jgi:hypothetical protein
LGGEASEYWDRSMQGVDSALAKFSPPVHAPADEVSVTIEHLDSVVPILMGMSVDGVKVDKIVKASNAAMALASLLREIQE